jgi:hypothetical protein
MSTTLIVANQTLPSSALADAITARIRSGVISFYVVVPATPVTHGFTWDEDETRRDAAERLEAFLARLKRLGVEENATSGR